MKGLNAENRIPLKKAQEEANLIQGKMRYLPEKMRKPEDYDKALAIVQEIMDAAEKEPTIIKELARVARLVNRSRIFWEEVLVPGLTAGKLTLDYGDIESFKRFCKDAEYKLNQLKKDAQYVKEMDEAIEFNKTTREETEKQLKLKKAV